MKHIPHLLFGFTALLFVACTPPERIVDFQGHRGARGLLPENSLPAFAFALDLHEVRTLELDLCVSADSVLVISHEPWMNPAICGLDDSLIAHDPRAYNLFQMTIDSIQGFDCGSFGHPNFPEQKAMPTYKPTLTELFELVHARGGNWPYFNIETKTRPDGDGVFHPGPRAFIRLLKAELEAADALYPEVNLLERVTVQSFDPRTLKELPRQGLHVRTCLLTDGEPHPEEEMDALGFPVDVYSPNYTHVTADLVQWCHFRRIAIVPWTVNDTATMQGLLDLGVDGLISDYPNKFAQLSY